MLARRLGDSYGNYFHLRGRILDYVVVVVRRTGSDCSWKMLASVKLEEYKFRT